MRRLEHVGIAVTDAHAVADVFHALFGRRPYKEELVSGEQVRTHFLEAGQVKIELLESEDPDSALGRYLHRHGPGLHHLAFQVDDLDAAHDRLAAAGFRLLGEPRPGADGKRIFFVHPKDTAGVLVECCSDAPPAETPLTGAGPTDGPACLVVGPPEARGIAQALSRRLRVWFDPEGRPAETVPAPYHLVAVAARAVVGSADGAGRLALVDPSPDEVPEEPAGILIIDRQSSGVEWRADVVVSLPRSLLDHLPDPDTVVADLIIAHLTA